SRDLSPRHGAMVRPQIRGQLRHLLRRPVGQSGARRSPNSRKVERDVARGDKRSPMSKPTMRLIRPLLLLLVMMPATARADGPRIALLRDINAGAPGSNPGQGFFGAL